MPDESAPPGPWAEREPVEGMCHECGRAELRRYPALSEGLRVDEEAAAQLCAERGDRR